MILSNVHTHTNLCDGKDTPEEIVLEAIRMGFKSIGFSGHSYTHFDEEVCMSVENTAFYKDELRRLKEKYSDKIDLLIGIEQELYSDFPAEGYEYIIGSVHYLKKDGCFIPVDLSAEISKKAIDEHFGGSGIEYAKAYFELTAQAPAITKCDIVGHFDLITKYRDTVSLFDTESPEYISAALESLHTAAESCKVFEINSGAISRGYRTTPYPDIFILKELKKMNCNIIITSDCHDKRYLDCEYALSEQILRSCGFKSTLMLTKKGFEEVAL